MRLYGPFDKVERSNPGELGHPEYHNSTPTIAMLGRSLIPAREALLATANSLVEQQLA